MQPAEAPAASPDGYVPEYAIEIEDLEMDETTKGDVRELRVTTDVEEMASFDFTLNNWDDVRLRFKYSDQEQFAVGKRVQVRLGYADRLVSMVIGQITTLQPSFPESGSPTVAISGLDGMLKLRDRKQPEGTVKNYRGRTDWQIATEVATRNGMRPVVTEEGQEHPLVVQKNQDDASFLMERAKRIDFDCYVLHDPVSEESTLHFVKPTDGRDGRPLRVYRLLYGPGIGSGESRPGALQGLLPSLIDFTPTLTVAHQVGKLTVCGWDPRAKQSIRYTASAADLPGAAGRGRSGPEAVEDATPGKQDVVVDAPVDSEQEARELAVALLRERSYNFITGRGRVAGLPELRAGDNLEIEGLGTRFSGSYYVKQVEHTLGDSGYFTSFEVRRVYDGGRA